MLKTSPVSDWPAMIGNALLRLNIPPEAVGCIVQRQQDYMAAP
jgi:hypothetical protein